MIGYALRELWRDRARMALVIFVLVVGFLGPFLASGLRSSVARFLDGSSRRLLSADLSVSSLRPFEKNEIEWLRREFGRGRLSQETEFVTMARGPKLAAFVEVKGVDAEYPIRGEFRLRERVGESADRNFYGRDLSDASEGGPVAWVYPEVLEQLSLKVGDTLGVGRLDFRIAGVLREAPGTGRTGGFAPRLFVARRFIDQTGLTQYGAQVNHRVHLELPIDVNPNEAAVKIKIALQSPDISVRTPDDAIQGFERFFKVINIYLTVIAMVVFVLSWVAAFYILQVHIRTRARVSAILLINGAGRGIAFSWGAMQVAGAVVLAFVIAAVFSRVSFAAIAFALRDRLPEGFNLEMSARDVLILGIIALGSSVAYLMPFFVLVFGGRLGGQSLGELLKFDENGVERFGLGRLTVTYAPALVVFLALAAWLMASVGEALKLAGGMVIVGLVGYFAGRIMFRAFGRVTRRRPGFCRLVAMELSHSRFGVNLCFLTVMMVALSLNLVPHLLASVEGELTPLVGRELPALFLFNIPESSLEALSARARPANSASDFELRFVSPLVLGRLLKVNGIETMNEQFLRFPVRLTYRAGLIPSEEIVAGREFSGRFNEAAERPAEISVETRFAERNKLKLGDEIEFEVQSLPLRARIVNLRRVRWTSFNPNFFIVFQAGVLEDAPKTWIANLNIDDQTDAEARKASLQHELSRDFPDLTALDIGRTIHRVLEVVESVMAPVRLAALAAVVMSFLILVGSVAHNLRLRERELDLKKLLGAEIRMIRNLILAEYAVLAAFGWLVGAAGAMGLAWVTMSQILDITMKISWPWVWGSLAGVLACTSVAVGTLSDRVLGRRGAARRL